MNIHIFSTLDKRKKPDIFSPTMEPKNHKMTVMGYVWMAIFMGLLAWFMIWMGSQF